LADRYISDRFLPDKAIDLVDEAGSRARLNVTVLPQNLKDKDTEIVQVSKDKDTAIASQEYEKAARLRDKEKELRKALDEAKKKWKEKREASQPTVSAEDIASVVSKWTGIPVQRLTEKEQDKLIHLEIELHKRVVGQEEAIKSLSQAIRRSRTGLKDPKRPIGSFIFLGPTGVGKTELAKAVSEVLFGEEDAMVRIDMSEYMEKFSVSRLIGAPPGYVGYEEGGQLTEAVRRKPYSVVLLDEIEKAHPDVFNILLQVLDDGLLTDNLGHKVNFKNTVIIMTSNVGARMISKGKSLGFLVEDDAKRDYQSMKETVMEEVKKAFNPEFLNRIDDVIFFHALSKEDMKKIFDIMFNRVREKLKVQGYTIELTEDAKAHLLEKGFDPHYGARPLQRTIQRLVEDAVASDILSKRFSPPCTIYVDFDLDEKKLTFNTQPVVKAKN
jgi:ATP-dependent Clp protease ATP-binding subunit ClpC